MEMPHDPSARSAGVAVVPRFSRRLPRGQSDPVGPIVGGGYYENIIGCGCDPADGAIVLFYAYVALSDPKGIVSRLQAVCEKAGVTGKLRIAAEGINGTAAGTTTGIESLVKALREDPDTALAEAAANMDFKPSPGCSHLFDNLSVRLVPEIVPFDTGQPTGAQPRGRDKQRQRRWQQQQQTGEQKEAEAAVAGAVGVIGGIDADGKGHNDEDDTRVGYVEPLEFHRAVVEATRHRKGDGDGNNNIVILDVRNWYESRVGHFDGAVLAPIRRFSQFPEYVAQHREKFAGKDVLMYCTGGIRCEKAAKYLADLKPANVGAAGDDGSGGGGGGSGRPASVRQLRGGIVAYARDILGQSSDAEGSLAARPVGGGGSGGDGDEVKSSEGDPGAKSPSAERAAQEKSMFRGCNYVFDNRGAVRVTDEVMTWCDGCGAQSDRLDKCASQGCHCILIVCEACNQRNNVSDGGGGGGGGVHCCGPCKAQDDERRAGSGQKRRRPCDCDNYEARARRLLPCPPQ